MEINLQTQFGNLQGNFPVPIQEIRLSELAWNLMPLDDKLINMAVATEAKQGRQISCRKGCGACCRQAVPLSPAEAWMLADIVSAFPVSRQKEIQDRFSQARERLQAAGFGDRSLTSTADESEVLNLGIDYFKLNISCPFLEDDSCSIHVNRPSACREYLVTSPAENCSQLGVLPTVGLPLALSLTEALSKLSAIVLETEPEVIPLTLALEWAAEHKAEGQRRYDGGLLLTTLVGLMDTTGTSPS
jgi:Fe-S-cluster containining protein